MRAGAGCAFGFLVCCVQPYSRGMKSVRYVRVYVCMCIYVCVCACVCMFVCVCACVYWSFSVSSPYHTLSPPTFPFPLRSFLFSLPFHPCSSLSLSILALPFPSSFQSGRLYPDTDSSGRTKDLAAPLIIGENQICNIITMIYAFIPYYD